MVYNCRSILIIMIIDYLNIKIVSYRRTTLRSGPRRCRRGRGGRSLPATGSCWWAGVCRTAGPRRTEWTSSGPRRSYTWCRQLRRQNFWRHHCHILPQCKAYVKMTKKILRENLTWILEHERSKKVFFNKICMHDFSFYTWHLRKCSPRDCSL